MDSIIMPAGRDENFIFASMFIFVAICAGFFGAVALGNKFNKNLPSKYQPSDDVNFHAGMIFVIALAVIPSSVLIWGFSSLDEKENVQNARIEYFHDTYGVNLTEDQMQELQYPSEVPEKGVNKLYGTTTTWLETESSSGPIEVGLAWVDDEFRLVPIGQQ